jgi:hypothetical protein
MQITIEGIRITYQSYDVTIDECKFIQSGEQQADGSVLFRISAVHTSGIPIPFFLKEGLEYVEFVRQ